MNWDAPFSNIKISHFSTQARANRSQIDRSGWSFSIANKSENPPKNGLTNVLRAQSKSAYPRVVTQKLSCLPFSERTNSAFAAGAVNASERSFSAKHGYSPKKCASKRVAALFNTNRSVEDQGVAEVRRQGWPWLVFRQVGAEGPQSGVPEGGHSRDHA